MTDLQAKAQSLLEEKLNSKKITIDKNENINTLKNELKLDYEIYLRNIEYAFFYRIKFDSTNIYLTKTNFYNRFVNNGITSSHCDPLIDGNEQGYCRFFTWSDIRAKEFIQFELGQTSPRLGMARLIGKYTPCENDLKDIQYMTPKGKSYFESAYNELNNTKVYSRRTIDIDNFMKMSEIIPTGAQGKAIYGDGDYIIDGPAGTGKSTTVLQKIKLLQDQNGIPSDKIHVIVKNENIINIFLSLAKSLQLSKIDMYTVEIFLDRTKINRKNLNAEILLRAYEKARKLVDSFENITKILYSQTFLNKTSLEHLINFGSQIQSYSLLYEEYSNLIELQKKHIQLKLDNEELLYQFEQNQNNEFIKYREKEKEKLLDKQEDDSYNLMYQIKHIFKKNEQTKKLNFENKAKFENKISKYLNQQQSEFKKKRKKITKKIQNSKKKYTKILDLFIDKFFNTETFEKLFPDEIECYLISRYINKLSAKKFINNLHTIIVDEAQDVSAVAIEFIRLHADSIILTGDELQKESDDGIGNWSNILFSHDYKIYHLKHNFRQTYELGNMCYNYRQLVLEKSIIDIHDEYFENQKGFSQARRILIEKEDDFIALLLQRIDYVKETFTTFFPVVVFYENKISLENLKKLCSKASISYAIDKDINYNTNKKILFVKNSQIAGREFPVVIIPLISSVDYQSLYIMLSRVKFDLTLTIKTTQKTNKYIQILIKEGLIDTFASIKYLTLAS